jgi:light-regulated signal transduction histidine kinase (bacteriophytochrome)
MLENIRQATNKMNRLIDDLLKLSRITRSQMNIEAVCLSDIATSIYNQLKTADPARQVETSVSPGLMVQGDANLLQIALDNLLRNAWKFTSRTPQAHIEFGSQSGSEGDVYYVRDNGAGFNMQYVEKLFIPFQRLHGEDEFEGTGVGLATVRRIVQRHNGRIWAEAEPDKGAAFFFTLDSG